MRLTLDCDTDACFEGQVPVAALCTCGRLAVLLVHTQL